MTPAQPWRLTIGSLFSGIGGLELGLEMCGLGPVLWQAERDPYAYRVLEHHWPDARRYRDVRRIDATAERPDVICGGFPCQDVSVAGKGAGVERGARSGLWREFARIVRDLRPGYVFVENVAALTGRGLDIVLGNLAALGFDAEWDVFRASDVGAPHRRERLFILAYSPGARLEGGGQGLPRLGGRWPAEPTVGRMAHGLSARVDRLRCLGNAVVSQCAALAWRTLMERACAAH